MVKARSSLVDAELAADKYVAQTDYLYKERALLGKAHELAAQQSHAHELIGSITEQRALATVRIEAFPYTRYGYLTGAVVSARNEAIQDKKLDLTFVAHIRLPTNRIFANGQWTNLMPGIAVTAEIKTGKRIVAHCFLDSVMQTGQESMRER